MLRTLPLDGTWKLGWADGQRGRLEHAVRDEMDPVRWIDAQVPGEVHLDLWRAGRIADPYVGTNCLAARWVEENYWSYRREFVAPAAARRGRAWLVFEGLDYGATIVLNGAEIGKHANVFHPCRLEVTGKLRAGRNVLVVHLESGLYSVAEKPITGLQRTGDHPLHKSIWLRKPQCQFGWDWSTRLVNVGIFKPVRLEWTSDAVRVDQFVPLAELSADRKTGTVRARVFVEGFRKNIRATLTVSVSGTVGYASRVSLAAPDSADTRDAYPTPERTGETPVPLRITQSLTIQPGLHPYEVTVTVPEPKLWWPAGHGPQHRYTVRAALAIEEHNNGVAELRPPGRGQKRRRGAGKIVAEKTARIGFRHVRVNQEKHPRQGRYFIFEVNGKKIFAKGGNWVPPDMIFARCDRRRYDVLTDRAREANFNLLRIWGGGQYESDDFYDLCDQKGLLVWQEFIFACFKYPATDLAFYDSVRTEATYNIRRLASHPSLVAWCGNNEIEWGYWDWGFDKSQWVHPDHALFHLVLPRLLAAEDPTRYYQPSSPWSPDGLNPNADHVGDQHPWSIGMGDTDFRKYRQMECRFPNEGGFLGPTALPTMRACLPPGQEQIQSWAWQIHDNSVDSWGDHSQPDRMPTQWLGKDIRRMSIADYTYYGGLVHGEALGEYIANFRRRMFDCASAIFWMYNDTWPATRSWTIVDYYLRRTPAFHPVRRALAPVQVFVAETGGTVTVFGVNETDRVVTGELRYGLFQLAGGYPLDERRTVALAPNASTPLAEFSRRAWKNPRTTAAFAMLQSPGGGLLGRHRLFLPFFKELRWVPARVNVRVTAGQAVFRSARFAWGVCLDLDGERRLADNFFDVYPGVPYSIPWRGRTPPRVLRVGNLG